MGFFSDRANNKRIAITKEFVFDTIRRLDYVVTREKLSQFIKLKESSEILYAYLYGIAIYTWSVRVTTIDREDYTTIFDIVDEALNESGINIPRHLDLGSDYDEISSGFNDIFAESIGINSVCTAEDIISSVDADFQSIGVHYARAYGRNDMELAKIYFVKLINTIDEVV
jgi:hypothetical protein